MSSIIYVHTHRFYSEIVTFFNNFNQLQNVMNRIREAAAGSKISQSLPRGIRIKLDIEAGSPLLLLPMSAYSTQILLVDLGNLFTICLWLNVIVPERK
jgi:vacuolar protein sorting-associated protein 13D